jgi:hypothetical protein
MELIKRNGYGSNFNILYYNNLSAISIFIFLISFQLFSHSSTNLFTTQLIIIVGFSLFIKLLD